jgi:hypothetical protein
MSGASSDLAPDPAGDYSNTVVENNVLLDTGVGATDHGAIYVWNPNAHKSTNVVIRNNFIRDYLGSSLGHGIYLDYEASNITITGNVISGAGTNVIFSDSDNVVFTGNLVDLEDGTIENIWYLNITGHQAMTGNVVDGNVWIVNAASFSTPAGVDVDVQYHTSPNAGAVQSPECTGNFYYNYNPSGPLPNSGDQWTDSHPQTSSADPGISGWDYQIAKNSPIYAQTTFAPLKRGWGPPGFSLPQSGTAPSCPH